MNNFQRNNYLNAIGIDSWIPRVTLPYAAPSPLTEEDHVVTKEINQSIPTNKDTTVNITTSSKILEPSKQEQSVTSETAPLPIIEIPHFSLQLMQAGSCLLLIELPTREAFQIDDPVYQLLRNILRAAKLPDSPQWLGDVIHWPLFKQASIPQSAKEAQEFLQSFINTYQEQIPDTHCLWLIGLASIHYTLGLDDKNYYQAPITESLGQTLLSPSLEQMIDNPQYKASLWHSIRQLIPLWQPQ